MTQVDHNEETPAYNWGRLLAVLEAVQQRALAPPGRSLNSTIVHRFYGAASTAPGTVFGRLLAGAQDHLKKLAGPLGMGGAAEAYKKQIEEISLKLQPDAVSTRPLTLPEQALFALGYYHERARMRAEIADRAAANRAKKDAASQTGETGDE